MELSPAEADTPQHKLFSPEGVRLDLPVAGPAPRMCAYAIDFVLILALIVLLIVALLASLPIGQIIDKWIAAVSHQSVRKLAQPNGTLTPALGAAAGLLIAGFVLVQFAIETGYFIFWEMVSNGRSPGKMVLGLRVVRRDGLPIDPGSSVVRNLMRIVDLLPANYAVGLVSIVLSASCERVGDHVAGTIVIRLDRPETAQEIETGADAAEPALTREQLKRIGLREVELIRGTLRRVASLAEDRREALLAEVAEAISARLEIEPPRADPRGFLGGVLKLAERYSHN